jgi:uncharacterized iron-regulated membrane protein
LIILTAQVECEIHPSDHFDPMKLHILDRKVHYWLAIGAALPVFVIICTGLLLQLKKQAAWVQPPEKRGVGTTPSVSLDGVLAVCRRVDQANIRTWEDIHRIDLRPGRGMMKVTAKNNWEIQVDAQTGEVLQVAYRRSDLLEAIHDGSWFHDWAKLGLFFPAGITLLALWLTGLYLFFLPIWARRKKRLAAARAPGGGANP